MQATRFVITTRTEDGRIYWASGVWADSISEAYLYPEIDEAEVDIEQNRVKLEGEHGPFRIETVTVNWQIVPR